MYWIALDLGSTHTKCAVLDSDTGDIRWRRQESTPPGGGMDGRHETDAEAYFQQAQALLMEATTPDIAGILLSTQMHGYVLTDEANRPVSPFVSWQDRLAVPYLDALRTRLPRGDMERTGVPLKPNLAMCMLYARLQEGLALAEGTRFHTLGGYIIARLTGAHVCHSTNAAPIGLLDVPAGQWNHALIDAAGLGGLRFGQVLHTLRPAGVWRYQGHVMPVLPDIGDHQVCVYGAELPQETGLHINIGTAGLLGVVTRTWSRGAYETRPWVEPDAYLKTISGLPGGRMVDSMAQAEYPQVAEAYREAARRIGSGYTQAGYSGGCALHNAALRAEIFRALGMPGAAAQYSDVMRGMRRLALAAEELHAGGERWQGGCDL